MNWFLHRDGIVSTALWRPIPNTGIQEMEEEHERLLGYLSELREAMAAGEGYVKLRWILADLKEYSRHHFRKEEEIMADWRFPQAMEHIRDHEAILRDVNQMMLAYDMGTAVFAADVANVLQRWISNHVANYDMKLAEFLMMNGEF